MKLKERLGKFFFPAPGSPRWMFILPYLILGVLVIALLAGGTYGWDYTNSPKFCGYSCHTMPPQNATYLVSPHANVYCTECHIGRAFVGQQFARKSEDIRELYSMVFHTYEFPIRATRSRPAVETCEKCHLPETFSDDSLRTIQHYADDESNTASTTYLILKTGGGAKREGQGRGIHWHIVNKVEYYSADAENQNIPYIRVYNDDGTTNEYVDVEANFDKSTLDESKLKPMDCLTCHNRVSHKFQPPVVSVNSAMARGLIDPSIPGIHKKSIDVLSASYASRAEAMTAIDNLEADYKSTDFYAGHEGQISRAVEAVRDIYDHTFFSDQKVDWTTHPNNIGHVYSAGCFRCHDGKHLDANQQAIRMECNLCHSIPVVANQQDFVTKIEISRGPEPDSHRNPNWISLHNKAFDQTCSACHNTADAGTTENTSFCSNSACHGSTFTFAGFDAPKLRDILQAQLPPPAPTPTSAPTPAAGALPDYNTNIAPLFGKCTVCHNSTALTGGLDLSSYEALMKGGKDGAVITPNDSTNSMLVKIQSSQHFAVFSADELSLIEQWINAGALPGSGPAPTVASSDAPTATPPPVPTETPIPD